MKSIITLIAFLTCATASAVPSKQQVEQKVQQIMTIVHVDIGASISSLSGDTNLLSDLMYPNGLILFKKYPGVFGANYAALDQRADENCGRDNYTIRCVAEQVLTP